jgi:Major Facilitator Superfamily
MRLSPGILLGCSRLFGIASDRIGGLVLPWFLLGITGNAAKTSTLMSIYKIPVIGFAIVLGILAHKLGAKVAYISATGLLIITLLLTCALYAAHGLTFGWLVPVSLVLGAGESLQSISLTTFIVEVSNEVNLPRYYSFVEVADAVSTFLGPLIGGLIMSTGSHFGLMAQAAFLAVSIGLFMRVPGDHALDQEKERRLGIRELLSNLREVASATTMPRLALVWVILNIQGGILFLLVVLIGRGFLHMDAVSVATALSAAGAGAVIGSLLSSWTMRRRPLSVAVYTFGPGLIGSGLLIATVATRHGAYLPFACFLIDLSSSMAFVLTLVWNAEVYRQLKAKSVVTGLRASFSGLVVAIATLALCSSAVFSRLLLSTVVYTSLFLILLVLIAGIKPPSPWSNRREI